MLKLGVRSWVRDEGKHFLKLSDRERMCDFFFIDISRRFN